MVETAEVVSPATGPTIPIPDTTFAREAQAVEFLRRQRAPAQPAEQKGPKPAAREEAPPPKAPVEAEAAPGDPGNAEVETEAAEGEEESTTEIDPATKIRVKASGEFRDVSFQELKDSYASKAELSRLANLTLEAKKAAEAQRDEYGSALTKAKALMEKMKGSPPSEELLDTNPAEYMKLQKAYEKRIAALDAIDGELAKVKDDGSRETAEKQRAYANEQYGKIVEKIPDFEKIKGGILEHAMALGASEDQIRGVHPHWLYVMAKNSMEYEKLKAENPRVTKALRQAPTMTRPGAQNPQDPNREINELRTKMNTPGLRPSEKERLTMQMFKLQRAQNPEAKRRG